MGKVGEQASAHDVFPSSWRKISLHTLQQVGHRPVLGWVHFQRPVHLWPQLDKILAL